MERSGSAQIAIVGEGEQLPWAAARVLLRSQRDFDYLTPQDMLRSEQEAARLGLDVIGVFHSHPDHPNQPSEFDRQWAMPWFSYIITSVNQGTAAGSRSWRLADDRAQFVEESIQVIER